VIGDLFQNLPSSAAAQRDAISQAAAACAGNGLRVALVLDDTDKWASTEDRVRVGRRFFDEALNALVDVGLPVVANAHPRYFVGGAVPDRVDTVIRVPRVSEIAIGRILARRVESATDEALSIEHVIEDNAIGAIARIYASSETMPLRRMLQIVSEALLIAAESNLDRITIGAVEAATDELTSTEDR